MRTNYTGFPGMEDMMSAARNSERLDRTNSSIGELKCDIMRLEITVKALCKVLMEKGVTAAEINAKIEEVIDSKPKNNYQKNMKPCPGCGRTIQESGKTPMLGRCLFCGEEVRFYPYIEDESAEAQAEQTQNDDPLSGIEDGDGFGF